MGLGHARRNLTIARALAGPETRANVLMITGANVVSSLAMPRGVDCLTLPAIHKGSDGQYQSRSLDLPLGELTSTRSKTIRGALDAYDPDVLIVDNVPRGANAELDETLRFLHARGSTHCVLGLRDVLDSPETVAREWQQRRNEEWIERYYDAVWVYGDPNVLDPVQEYGFSKEIAARLQFTGYLDRNLNVLSDTGCGSSLAGVDLPLGEILLCLAGGGQDGCTLARTVCEATLPTGMDAVILTGPFMPLNVRQRLRAYAVAKPHLQVLEFHPEPVQLMMHADRIISMGGYNTISEILSLQKRALVVPRIVPRREQLIRAERLETLGLLDVIHPELLTPEAITRWVTKDASPIPCASELINFNGLSRLSTLLEELVRASDPVVAP
jgi:predicted glycosyltransferase